MPLVPGGDSRLHQTYRGLKPSLVVPKDADSVMLIDRQLHSLSTTPMTLFESVLHNPEHNTIQTCHIADMTFCEQATRSHAKSWITLLN